MNAIIGLLELTLRKGGLNDDDRGAIQVVYQSSNDLLGLIGDILDLSKIESGKLELSPSPHRISELGRAVINVFSAVARQKGLTLTGAVSQINHQATTAPAPSDRYTRGFLTGRPRVFSLFMALTYAMTSPTWPL